MSRLLERYKKEIEIMKIDGEDPKEKKRKRQSKRVGNGSTIARHAELNNNYINPSKALKKILNGKRKSDDNTN